MIGENITKISEGAKIKGKLYFPGSVEIAGEVITYFEEKNRNYRNQLSFHQTQIFIKFPSLIPDNHKKYLEILALESPMMNLGVVLIRG